MRKLATCAEKEQVGRTWYVLGRKNVAHLMRILGKPLSKFVAQRIELGTHGTHLLAAKITKQHVVWAQSKSKDVAVVFAPRRTNFQSLPSHAL